MKYHIFQNVLFLLKDIKKEYPLLLLFIFMQMILSVVSPVFGIYIPKIALDLVAQQADYGRIFLVLGVFGLVMALSMALSGMAGEISEGNGYARSRRLVRNFCHAGFGNQYCSQHIVLYHLFRYCVRVESCDDADPDRIVSGQPAGHTPCTGL